MLCCSKKGFTLIELLAVIVILAIILVIAVPQILKVIDNTRQRAVEMDAKIIQRELERKRLTKHIDLRNLTISDLKDLGVKAEYTEFEAFIIDDEVHVTLEKNGYRYSTGVRPPIIYGVSWNGLESELTRTNNSVGLTYTVNASTITSDFDTAEIYRDIKEVTDTYENKFMSIPKFYIKKTVNGDAWTWQISTTKVDEEYYLPACFYDFDNNKELPYVLVGKYAASLNEYKLESKSGTGRTINNINDLRMYAKNNNTELNKGYQLLDIHVVDVLQTLFYVEFATLDSQTIMAGNVKKSWRTGPNGNGLTDDIGSLSGSTISNWDGLNSMKYRGIENLYGNLSQFVDGINLRDNQSYVALNSNYYQSDKFDGEYEAIGYLNSNISGWIKKVGYDANYPFLNLPIENDEIETELSPYKDSYNNDLGDKVALFGGNFNNFDRAGVISWDFSCDSLCQENSMGSRLIKKPL